MSLLRFLRLAPARNAIRKLFRRPLPGGSRAASSSSSTDTDTDTEIDASSSQPSSVLNTVAREPTMPAIFDTQTVTQADKENRPPSSITVELSSSLAKLGLVDQDGAPAALKSSPVRGEVVVVVDEDPQVSARRARHLHFIGEALDMARLALRTNETPVGCVLVHRDKIIAKGMNATNVTRNGTRHAEFMAISALLSHPPKRGPRRTSLKPRQPPVPAEDGSTAALTEWKAPDEGNEDGKKGHLYPYGQRFHPRDKVSRNIIRECDLYVTVEPCVMCASLLRQLGIRKVYFGAVNDKFGGTGGVFSIHANSHPVSEYGQTASAHPTPRPSQLPDGSGTLGTSYPSGGGDGGNVEAGFEIEGGWGRDEAVGLLRRFYVQENGRAPVPRKKEGRAARLAAMMEQDMPMAQAEEVMRREQEAEEGEMLQERAAVMESVMSTEVSAA